LEIISQNEEATVPFLVNRADPPIVMLVENNNHDEANQPDENRTDRNIPVM
jgi:hypothetical protein